VEHSTNVKAGGGKNETRKKTSGELMDQATSKVRSDIVQCQSELTYNEQIYDKMNPPVVTEYLAANDSDRMTFEKVFRSFKVSTELKARANWYDWKFGMMEKVRPDVEEVLDEMVQVGLLTLFLVSSSTLLVSCPLCSSLEGNTRDRAFRARLVVNEERTADILGRRETRYTFFRS
jgi:hypothetical protein